MHTAERSAALLREPIFVHARQFTPMPKRFTLQLGTSADLSSLIHLASLRSDALRPRPA
jgi:hypothetical protein